MFELLSVVIPVMVIALLIFAFVQARRDDPPPRQSLDSRPPPLRPIQPETKRPIGRTPAPARVGSTPRTLKGKAWVVDGDTIVIEKVPIRIFGIDAPEMDQPYGRKAKSAMMALCRGRVITATVEDHSSYERAVAICRLPDGTDLAGELVRQGLALDWKKFSGGKYRHLEPDGVRRRLWRVEAKHRGRLRPDA